MHTYLGVTKLQTSLKRIKILLFLQFIYGALHCILSIMLSIILQH